MSGMCVWRWGEERGLNVRCVWANMPLRVGYSFCERIDPNTFVSQLNTLVSVVYLSLKSSKPQQEGGRGGGHCDPHSCGAG